MGIGGGQFYVIKYAWLVDADIDTQTKMISPVTSQNIGWATPNPNSSSQATLPVGNGYVMTWGGDELVEGAESVLIDVGLWRQGYGQQNILEFELRASRFENVAGSTAITISVQQYGGGQMTLNDVVWVNPTATYSRTNYPTFPFTVTQTSTAFPPLLAQYVTKLRLNLATDTVTYFN